jgi:hypothetical protein
MVKAGGVGPKSQNYIQSNSLSCIKLICEPRSVTEVFGDQNNTIMRGMLGATKSNKDPTF